MTVENADFARINLNLVPGKKKQCCEKRRCVNIISRSVPITLDTMSVRPSTSEVSSYNGANMLCIMTFRLWQ